MGRGAEETDTPVARLHVLETDLNEVCGHLNLLHARMVQLVADALDSGAWAQWGILSPAHWLAWKTGLSPSRAKAIVRIAEHHKGLIGITGNADTPGGLTFTDRWGDTLHPGPSPTNPSGPPPTPAKPYKHPLGDTLEFPRRATDD